MPCWKMVKKIKNIIKGWYYKFFNKHDELANKRIAICRGCTSKIHIDKVGDICAECGCILDAKARVQDEYCELNKWYKL